MLFIKLLTNKIDSGIIRVEDCQSFDNLKKKGDKNMRRGVWKRILENIKRFFSWLILGGTEFKWR